MNPRLNFSAASDLIGVLPRSRPDLLLGLERGAQDHTDGVLILEECGPRLYEPALELLGRFRSDRRPASLAPRSPARPRARSAGPHRRCTDFGGMRATAV